MSVGSLPLFEVVENSVKLRLVGVLSVRHIRCQNGMRHRQLASLPLLAGVHRLVRRIVLEYRRTWVVDLPLMTMQRRADSTRE